MINLILIITLALSSAEGESGNLTNIIALKFKTYKEPYDESTELKISSIIKNHIYTEIEIGNQLLVASFNTDEYGFYMTDEDCLEQSNYIIQKSKTFTNASHFDEGGFGYASEILSLYRDINFKIKLDGYYEKMYISKYNNNKQCAVFGLKIKEHESNWDSKPNFINTYHKHGNILNYKWTMKYETDDEGTLVVGDSPVNYDPSFKNKKYTEFSTNGAEKNSLAAFGITFDEITINKEVLGTNLKVYFYHEYNAIIVTSYYLNIIKEEFFKDYFNKSICREIWEYGKYGGICCHKNFTEKNMKSFPTIYFKSVDLNYIFELNYKDLFTEEKDGNLYFLMITEINGDNSIKFGKPFLKKYTFTVDNDISKISYLVIEKEKKKPISITILIIIICAISFIFIIAIIFLIYKLLTKKGKKRANELDDDYEYMTKEEENKDNSNDPQIPLANNLGV